MADPIERSAHGGLNTDLTPDKLTTEAMDLRNVVPASQADIQPRNGSEAHYILNQTVTGRTIWVEYLPDDAENGLLVCMTRSNDVTSDSEVIGVYEFRPSVIPADLGEYGIGERNYFGMQQPNWVNRAQTSQAIKFDPVTDDLTDAQRKTDFGSTETQFAGPFNILGCCMTASTAEYPNGVAVFMVDSGAYDDAISGQET